MGWLSGLFGGGGPKVIADDRPPAYPTAADVAFARQNDSTYGDRSAAFVAPAQVTPTTAVRENQAPLSSTYSGQVPQYKTFKEMQRAFDGMDDKETQMGTPSPVASQIADRLAAAQLAVQRSALAGLGFDPRVMAFGVQPEKNLNIAGVYSPGSDRIISTGISETNPVHESMHRGMQMLRAAGMLPPELDKSLSEESVVRGMMLKNYGPVEKGLGAVGDSQVADGKWYIENRAEQLKQIEDAAAQLVAKRQPRGPR